MGIKLFSGFFFLVLFCFPFFAGAQVDIDLSEVMRCDEVYSPAGCVVNRSVVSREAIASETGIALPPSTGDFRGLQPGVYHSREARTEPPAQEVEQFEPEQLMGGSENVSAVETPSDVPEEESLKPQQERAFSQSSQPLSGNQIGGSSHSGLKNGYLYATEEPSTSGSDKFGFEKSDGNNQNQVTSFKPQNTVNAVALNRGNSQITKTPEGDSSPKSESPGAFASPGNVGNTVNGAGAGATKLANTPQQQNPNSSMLDRIGKIASSLGEKFFGLGGGSAARKRAGKSNQAISEEEKIKKLLSSATDPDFRNLLKKRLAKIRGLASQSEFGAAHSKIFNTVCLNYRRYAEENSLADIRHRCPDL